MCKTESLDLTFMIKFINLWKIVFLSHKHASILLLLWIMQSVSARMFLILIDVVTCCYFFFFFFWDKNFEKSFTVVIIEEKTAEMFHVYCCGSIQIQQQPKL